MLPATRFLTIPAIAAACLLLPALVRADDGEETTRTANRPATDDAAAREKAHPLEAAIEYAGKSLKVAEELEAYQASFYKRDVVNGETHAHSTFLKFRAKPFSVYMRFAEPHEGREVIYVNGQNQGRLLAHETGIKALVGTVSLLPTSARAMSESRHPITEIGIAKMADGVIKQWEAERKFGEIEVKYYAEATLRLLGEGRKHVVIEATHPRPRRQFKFHITRLWIDRETQLPVRVEQLGFPRTDGAAPPLMEEYTYSNVKTDVDFTDLDFDVRNPEYGF